MRSLLTKRATHRLVSRLGSGGAAAHRAYATAFPPHLLNHAPTQVTTLDNGIRVASQSGHGESAAVGVWVDAGSGFETEANNGVAHFLEHLIFKGTAKRTRTQLELEVENMGAKFNAYTSREQTVYYLNTFKKDVGKGVELLGDVLLNSTLSPEAVEAERSVILREAEEVASVTEEVVFDHLHSVAYQGTPLGLTILGPEKNIRTLTRDDITNYIQTHYTGNRIVVAAAGGVDHADLVTAVQASLGSVPAASTAPPRPAVPFTGSMVTVRDDTKPEAHLVFAAESVGWAHPEYFHFSVLQSLIGTWDRSMTAGSNVVSRLGELVATEGLVHSLSAFNTTYHDTGLFGTYVTTSVDEHHMEDLAYEVLNEWVRIGREATDAEVERAKQKLKAATLMQLDGHFAVAEDIGRQMLTLGRHMPAAEVWARIDAITAKDVRNTAYSFLNDVDIAVAAVGPIHGLPDYNQLRGWTYWNRL